MSAIMTGWKAITVYLGLSRHLVVTRGYPVRRQPGGYGVWADTDELDAHTRRLFETSPTLAPLPCAGNAADNSTGNASGSPSGKAADNSTGGVSGGFLNNATGNPAGSIPGSPSGKAADNSTGGVSGGFLNLATGNPVGSV